MHARTFLDESVHLQVLHLLCGGFLLAAVIILWRRELTAIVRLFAWQGAALGGIIAVFAAHERSLELALLAVAVTGLRAVALPYLVRRTLRHSAGVRETRPVVNVAASLMTAAVLTLIAYTVARPLVRLSDSPGAQAIPVGLAVILIGFFVLVTRRRAVSQVIGFLLIDNGITAVAFLTTTGVPLTIELAVSLDVLLAVLVLQILTTRMQEAFGDTDLGELRGLRD